MATHRTIDFSAIDGILESYEYKKSNLIAILQKIQEIYRYLPLDALTYVGTKIEELSPATVYGVATFYAQFSLDPKGKYEIKLCDGTARGSMPVLDAVRGKLGLTPEKSTSDDGMFSLETVSCLGACGLAPVIVINGKVYPKMTADAVKVALDEVIKQDKEA